MNYQDSPDTAFLLAACSHASGATIPELVGKINDAVPATERCRMLGHLLKPLGALGLVGVCIGIFANIWFRSGWHDLHIRPEDALSVRSTDVIAVADYV